MNTNLLTRQRTVDNQQIQEPTLLALVLVVLGFVLLLGIAIAAMATLPAFGYVGWTFAALAALGVWLAVGLRRKLAPPLATARQRWFRRILRTGRLVFVALLACWLGLFGWSAVCPGGPNPPPKSDPAHIRVVTWNLHCGQDDGPPWKQFDWRGRKHALREAVDQAKPDILCVQEATPQQVAFLEQALPGHQRVGVGRDDGKSGGEHCAIYFNRQRFEELDHGTFWLEEPIDQPRVGSALDVKRICTWVRLRERTSGRTLRVYNTHLYLTEAARLTANKLILAQVAAGDPADAVVLTADFNAGPGAPSRQLFGKVGLTDSAQRAGKPTSQPTFQLYGIGLWCLDGVLVDRHWRVHQHLILNVKPRNTFPSDHFAVLADLALRD
jgi:endonuclease/exonuclease/phosphatase family metal-dependent hydrolase